MLKFLAWICSVVFAFNLGAGVGSDKEPETELQKKVQEHMDVIVDESAAMVDDVMEELRKDERVQNAEKFVNDVQEIVDNTKADIDAHFGSDEKAAEETAEEAEAVEEPAQEAESEQAAEPAQEPQETVQPNN